MVKNNCNVSKTLEKLGISNETNPMIKKVNVNCHLYQVTKDIGMDEEAFVHGVSVLEHGGDAIKKRT